MKLMDSCSWQQCNEGRTPEFVKESSLLEAEPLVEKTPKREPF
jgi:hypothetical protein